MLRRTRSSCAIVNFPVEARVFKGGSSQRKGEVVPRQFLEALTGPERRPFAKGSGRLEMARAIVHPANPLTALVWVNRVWAQHFGVGLVDTPSDFGIRASPPSHPELLDWLASDFVARGWSTKQLHRQILLSATYRQQSTSAGDDPRIARAVRIDPENRLLWHHRAARLSFEEFRDTLAAVSGDLDRAEGGIPVELFPGGANRFRRSVYGKIDRQYLPTILRVFDFANPDLHTPQRGETIVPQQALFALNHPYVAGRARRLVGAVVFRIARRSSAICREALSGGLQRAPNDAELDQAVVFLGGRPITGRPLTLRRLRPTGPMATARLIRPRAKSSRSRRCLIIPAAHCKAGPSCRTGSSAG